MIADALLERSFVLVEGEWACARAARMVRALGADWVVVHLSDGGGRPFRVFARRDALDVLERHGDAPVESVLERWTGARASVVTRRGRIVGLEIEPEPEDLLLLRTPGGAESAGGIDILGGGPPLPPPPPAGSRGPTAGAGAGTERLSRAVRVQAPSQVGVDQRAWMVVQLIADMTRPGTVPVSTAVGESIGIVVQASGPIEIEGAAEGDLAVTAAGAPALRFRIHGLALGAGEITVYVFQGQQSAGSVTLAIDVVERPQPSLPEPSTVPIEPPLYEAPDLQLLVLETGAGYVLRLSAADPQYGLNLAPFGPFTIQPEPKAFFQTFYDDIQQILVADVTAQEKKQRLEVKGDYLFEKLLPPAARAHLWQLRSRIRSVHIQSEEPWIPWEMLKLSGDDGSGRLVDGGFLCEEFEVTRWVPGLRYKSDLTLANIGVVTPADAGLAAAEAERRELFALQAPGRNVTQIMAEAVALRSALKSATYDGLHFTGHGLATADNADRAEIRLEGNSRLRPEDLTGVVANLGWARPIVFLNGCQIGRAGLGMTGPGGWPYGFLAAGAGAFIGPYWNVIDASAAVFARTFYQGLLAGGTVGQAARDARLEIKASSDPTWLAYSVYSHSAARLR